MNLEELRNKYIEKGYTSANASAKICQDIILSKISKSPLSNNITIKGGVVMYNLSNDKRRATRDLDLDFIKYSLDDEYIKKFLDKLNDVNDGIKIVLNGKIEKLHHQDYNGKRVNIKLIDKNFFSLTTKLDIGVHKQFNIEQEEYCFDLDALSESATLFINSPEQIMSEKLKSLLKFGYRSTRYKDIFDFYYLINNQKLNKKRLSNIIRILIIEDNSMREKSYDDIVKDLNLTLNNKLYRSRLSDAKNNWLEIPVDTVINSVLDYIKTLN